ncbi:MAG: FAD-dependent oxidoreductase [Lachnospiraceae bacterium]|nr:FAD-dependent oxidoreductase [Lachnospiraceae bacterium]
MIKSISDLTAIKAAYEEMTGKYKRQALVCFETGSTTSSFNAVKETLIAELEAAGLTDEIGVFERGCMGTCAAGPVIIILPEETFYTEMTPEKTKEVVRRHLVGGTPVEEYTFYDKAQKKHVLNINETAFLRNQVRIALRNCGLVDVNSIDSYIARDGFLALARILERGDRYAVVEEMKKSGLRGRGGGGFPTGVKWEAAYNQKGDRKFFICNADEGDPGAFMDRSVFEGDPYSVIEGLLIGGYAIGADHGVVYIRAEYPIAVRRLKAAIEGAREAGILGEDIFGSGFNFDIEIRIGAGAFVCGEETALIASVEGKRGEPRQKPPFPFQRGLFDYPTIINNVETLACVPAIMLKGADWFRSFGTEKSPGTKVFALTGNIENSGLVEVPMGTPLSEIVFDIGGGIPNGKTFKAAQTGGPSGGCLTAENINVAMDFEHLAELGSIVGSGGLIVMDEDACMVDTARFYMDFIQEESCGKCTACRVGTKRMLEILNRITSGQGEEGDIEKLVELGETIKQSAMCGLGQTAPNPVLSTIKYFRHEYEDHIRLKKCEAGACADLVSSPCENTCPAGINIPGYMSLIATGNYIGAARVMLRDNPFSGICGRVCTHPCEMRCRRGTVDEKMNICELKRFATDFAYEMGYPKDEDYVPAARLNKKVAVIGAGPTGLTSAYYLARKGYQVDVFEAEEKPGGVMAYGIPEYRLPWDIIAKEIANIEKTGVKITCGKKIGKDEFAALKEEYDAVMIAIGAQKVAKMRIPGEDDLEGVYHGLDFLKRVSLKGDIDLKGKKVAVVGGGNTAIDSARTAVRLGAAEVQILYRRTEADMPADKVEIADAKEEGVIIRPLNNPRAFIGEDGVLKYIEVEEQTLGGYDRSGRRAAVPTGNVTKEEFDVVIPAISQNPDLDLLDEGVETKWGRVIADRYTQATTEEGVFVGGDASRGPKDIVNAVGDGKLAAQNIDIYLGGDGVLAKGFEQEITDYHIEGDIVPHCRFLTRQLSAKDATTGFMERNLGMHELDARAEASRCLRCDRR